MGQQTVRGLGSGVWGRVPESGPRTVALVIALALVLTGCGPAALRAPLPAPVHPAATITVFCDGFHSGILVRKTSLDLELDPETSGIAPIDYAWWAIHYGEQRWMTGEDESTLHALSLVFRPLPGGLQINHTDPALEAAPVDHALVRCWTFAIDASGLARVRQRLQDRWLGPVLQAREPWNDTLTRASPEWWSIWSNCHDFTVDLLDAAGIRLQRRSLTLAGGLIRDLDDATAERQERFRNQALIRAR